MTTRLRDRPTRFPTLVATLAATLLLSINPARASEPAAADLPITRVVLFTTGVAYIEHAGSVEGDAELELRLPRAAMDDLLQSLVVEDLGGGRVEPVRYGARDPLPRILASYALDLSRHPTLAELLAQARGERVRVETDTAFSGTILGIEHEAVPDASPRTFLTLSTATGLRRLDLSAVRELHFERAELRQQLEAALAAIASYREVDEVPVRLRFSGEATRDVRIGYLRAMPVWKTSYRLLLDDDGADLQGWAIFDNPTSLDFEDVELAFVAGRPASFISRLFEPVYVERPRLDAVATPSFVPPVDAGALPVPPSAAARALMIEPSMMAEMDSVAAEPGAPAAPFGAGVEALADAGAAGATYVYTVRDPVTVRRFESVLVPILRTPVEAHPLSLFARGVDPRHPLRGMRIVNDTGLHLAPGPVTLFDARGFTGSALLADLVPDDDRVLSYALDLELALDVTSASEAERVVSVRIVGGLLESEHRSRARTRYLIEPRGEVQRFLVIEQPRRPGFEVVAPSPAPLLTPDSYRFGVRVEPAGDAVDGAAGAAADATEASDPTMPTHLVCDGAEPCVLEVVLERVESRRVALTSVPLERIEAYLQDLEMTPETRERLEAIAALQRELLRLDRALHAERLRRDAIHADQARLRQNMAALDRTSALYRRYVQELTEQEDRLADIARAAEGLESERRERQEELEDLIEAFGGS
jgi:hypothetical protein